MKPKPCPFCGSAYIVQEVVNAWGESYIMQECQECKARGPLKRSSDKAIAAWNKREEKP